MLRPFQDFSPLNWSEELSSVDTRIIVQISCAVRIGDRGLNCPFCVRLDTLHRARLSPSKSASCERRMSPKFWCEIQNFYILMLQFLQVMHLSTCMAMLKLVKGLVDWDQWLVWHVSPKNSLLNWDKNMDQRRRSSAQGETISLFQSTIYQRHQLVPGSQSMLQNKYWWFNYQILWKLWRFERHIGYTFTKMMTWN